jgi:hypothetical protein
MAKTVLIVDDHAPFRALARALLQLEGFEVVGEAGKWWSRTRRLSRLRAAGRTQTCPADPTAGAYGGYAMRLRLGRARLLGGLVGAQQPGQGR